MILAYIFFFSPLFKIRAVEVSGNKEVKTKMIQDNFAYKNIFLFTKDKIRNDLMKKFPKISNIEVSKNLAKRIINLKVEERQRLGIICQVSEQEEKEEIKGCFYIDKKGFIFEDAPQTSGSLILLIKDYSQRELILGQQVFEKRIIGFISQTKQGLLSEIDIKTLDFNILSFPAKELKVITWEGWYILFDLDSDINSQLLALKASLEEKIQDRGSLEYIDLRIENRVYYK